MKGPQEGGADPCVIEARLASWIRRGEHKELVVAIIGLGYVGLPLMEAFVKVGFKVVGFDVDETKISAIKDNTSYIKHIAHERIRAVNETGRLHVTTDSAALVEADAILLCVPTPLSKYHEPDLSYVIKCCEVIAPNLRKGQLIALESTTWPGTSEEVMCPILERLSGLKAHTDFAIAYSPEREDPGNQNFSTSNIPKVVGANTDAERLMATNLYGQITRAVPVRDLKTAEAVKLVENIYRLVNIGLVNELNHVFKHMDIDVWEVVEAAKTKPFGFAPFYPGPGLGGHCIPIDPFYLSWKARGLNLPTRFIELAGEITRDLPRRVIEAVADALSVRLQKAVTGARVLVVGLAYKGNIDDMRESPSITLIELLRDRGAIVDYFDPFIPETGASLDHPEIANMTSICLEADNLAVYDCAIIATDHDVVDYERIVRTLPFVVDTRNALKHLQARYAKKIVKT